MSEDYRGYLKIAPNADNSYKHKIFEILGLKSEEDTHHIAYTMSNLAESVAKLHDVVVALDARVGKLEKAVERLENGGTYFLRRTQ